MNYEIDDLWNTPPDYTLLVNIFKQSLIILIYYNKF